ncbi:RNA 2',3'-cyclic phosphodiesterase [Spongiactinospora sp. TRM90649]|uniref:RNA 2',3'-cyclic phosphodiesterase n=1 Tax=Spongiactinospora sp. TRM90649 TaxID=3031114 RepID=UPI0023F877CF|nr:RNA 2',3'-cyclic phosphodiesterase [Spongiactinospora sp. TRM90649]MDF5757807.1 RNA 2',3'-cyclic phosphodiesterase [Spongiactinospora sp. TRM90649]
MRLFAALSPPPEALDEIEGALRPHRDAWPGLRWLNRESWHVTLSFFGEVPERALPDLSVRLARAAARHAPATLSFTGVGAFPSARRAKVVWCGMSGPIGRLNRLAASLGAGARRAGAVQVDEKPFRPHLSVARARADNRADIDVWPLVSALGSFSGVPWEASEVHLVRSHLGARVRYETVESWPLARTGQDDG